MNAINAFLIANTLLSNLLNFCCSSVTLLGLFFQRSDVRGFKATVADMAGINFLTAIVSMLLFPITVIPPGVNTYLLGQYYPDWLLMVLVRMNEALLRTSRWVLGIIFIYRTWVVLNPTMDMTHLAMFGSLLALGIPIVQVAFYQSYQVQMIQACDYWCTDQLMANQTNTGIWKKVVDIQTKPISDVIDVVLMTAVTVVGFKCRKKLHNFFKEGTFSEKTIRLQKRLSKGMLIMIMIHLATLYPILIAVGSSLLLTFLDVSEDNIEKISTVSTLLSNVVVEAWQMPVLSVVVFCSVRGFIRFSGRGISPDTSMFKSNGKPK